MATWKGFTILALASSGPARSHSMARRYAIVGPETGKRALDLQDDVASESRDLSWTCLAPSQIKDALDFLDATRGGYVPFWLSTYEVDLVLHTDLTAIATSMVVKFAGYTARLFSMGAARRNLRLRTTAGTEASVKVTASVDNADGTETLSLEAAAGAAFAASVTSIGIMRLVRSADDRMTLEHLTYGVATVKMSVVEVPKEAP